ncbi:hypothetical protein KY330_03500 [Candidatus Woesearchaeota archaeon]|nr:hypothetical protein [Candidatus Woesearchaeota archaeon]
MGLAKRILTGLMVAWLGLAQPCIGQEKPRAVKPAKQEVTTNLSYKTELLSRYVFRGFTFSDKPVLQLTTTANRGNFSLIGFGNYIFRQQQITEADLTLDYTRQIGNKLTLSTGYSLLHFPNTEMSKTQEFYAIFNSSKKLKPNLTLVHDFDGGKGEYAELSLQKGIDNLILKLSAAYNHHYYRSESGLSHYLTSVSIPMRKNLTAIIAYQGSLYDGFDDKAYVAVSTNF